MRFQKMLVPAAAALAAGAIAAGCGGDDDGDGRSAGGVYGGGQKTGEKGSQATAPAPGGNGAVAVADNPDLGRILVDSRGMTLYLFKKDKGGKSACSGACASVWPPLLSTGKPSARQGAQAGQLGTTKRRDGGNQVTYAGYPLYTYVGDKGPGDVNGNDFEQFGAEWYALTPAGTPPED
jgi:predicted lipoprotein with Yx(FWY)xxD motif